MDRLREMEIFVRVAETGSLSDAARHFGIGQPGVSKMISRMERRLDTRLVIRTSQGTMLTEVGRRFLDHAHIAIAAVDEAEQEARGEGTRISGRLRVSAATTFARLHIMPLLPAFLALHPDLEIDVILDDRIIDPAAEGVDVALRMGELQDTAMIARRIATGVRSVLATPEYLARHSVPSSPEALIEHETVIYLPAGALWTFSRDGCATTVEIRGRLRVSAAEGLREAVLADHGIAIASDWMFAPELSSGTVVRILAPWRLDDIDLWAVLPAGKLTSARARLFIDFVEATMRGGLPPAVRKPE